MTLEINQIHPLYAAEITGADIKQADPDLLQTIKDAVAKYAVVVLRKQEVSDEVQIQFSRNFGPLVSATEL